MRTTDPLDVVDDTATNALAGQDRASPPALGMRLSAVVLAGGAGTRLWPLSRKHFPKQLIDIIGRDSLLQTTHAAWPASMAAPAMTPRRSSSAAKHTASWLRSNWPRQGWTRVSSLSRSGAIRRRR